MPAEALDLLRGERGSILDVGGGAAPYFRARWVVDILPFSAERLHANRWGMAEGESATKAEEWSQDCYTQLDLCEREAWPFHDRQFDLGFCSHTLEDLRDPLPAVRELCRVSQRVLIVTPSRLAEQTKGMDHPRYCGFYHHPWMVYQAGGRLVFRRKTPAVLLPGCHIVCPIGRRLRVEYGASLFAGERFEAVEEVFWSERDEREDYARYVEPFRDRRDLFARDPRWRKPRYWIWKLRQKWLGAG